ncbi:MAG: RNA methyltransferase, partial [Bacteroidales bacterium]
RVKKYREEYDQFIAEGHKLVMDLLNSDFTIVGLYASADWIVANLPLTGKKNIPVFETTLQEMKRITSLSTPSPVLAVVTIQDDEFSNPQISKSPNFQIPKLFLALDDIRDPGNLGTIIRIADWFGLSAVYCSQNCVDIYNPKVVQATMGSIARVTVYRCDLASLFADIAKYKIDIPVYGALLEGESIFSHPLTPYGIILIGNESRGISPELIPFITQKIFIPSFGSTESGKAESLNASVAAAILCAEFRRKT